MPHGGAKRVTRLPQPNLSLVGWVDVSTHNKLIKSVRPLGTPVDLRCRSLRCTTLRPCVVRVPAANPQDLLSSNRSQLLRGPSRHRRLQWLPQDVIRRIPIEGILWSPKSPSELSLFFRRAAPLDSPRDEGYTAFNLRNISAGFFGIQPFSCVRYPMGY